MPERLDRVHVKLASRPEPFTLSLDSREQLLDQGRGRDELRGVVTAFEGAGASRPITGVCTARAFAAPLARLTRATMRFRPGCAGLDGPGWNRTTARSFEGCRSIR